MADRPFLVARRDHGVATDVTRFRLLVAGFWSLVAGRSSPDVAAAAVPVAVFGSASV
jgi:hypothetical protein